MHTEAGSVGSGSGHTVIQRIVIVAAEYSWESVSSIKGNCFETSDLLSFGKFNFGRAPTFESCGDFGGHLVLSYMYNIAVWSVFDRVRTCTLSTGTAQSAVPCVRRAPYAKRVCSFERLVCSWSR